MYLIEVRFYLNRIFPFALLIAAYLTISPVSAQNHLQLPVDFIIENGNFEKTIVNVKKEGIIVYSVPGKTFLKMKLEFNNEYIISFSKQGYITKSIAVSTTVPPERQAQTFEPYKIGVKLFRQYEGVNIVVYNQPVARIHFNPGIDDFDYDVDYSKSILSLLKQTEEELMVRAAEERLYSSGGAMIQTKEAVTSPDNNSGSSGQMIQQGNVLTTPGDQQREKEIPEPYWIAAPSSGESKEEMESITASQTIDDAEAQNNKAADAADDKNTNPFTDGAEEKPSVIHAQADKESIKGKSISNDEDPRKNKVLTSYGDDYKLTGESIGDIEIAAGKSFTESAHNMQRSILVEKNRTITTIVITKGVSLAEYRKVNYSWGGVFYFQGGNYAISKNIFHFATGEY